MAKKAAKKAIPAPGDRRMKKPDRTSATRQAPVKPERTRSRTHAATALAESDRKFQIEREGKVYEWTVPNAPYQDHAGRRAAFVGGFKSRVEQVNQGTTDAGPAERFNPGTNEQAAFEEGYHEAARQDGLHIKAKALTGSNTPATPITERAPRRTAGGTVWPNRPAREKKR